MAAILDPQAVRFFGVSRSGYYDFVHRLEQPAPDVELGQLLQEQQAHVRQTYGYRRMFYRQKIATFQQARELIDEFIYFYNHERIQLKTGVAPLSLRHSS